MSDHVTYYGYDIETFSNCFTLTAINIATGYVSQFEVSERRDDTAALMNFIAYLRTIGATMVGFNNIGFDYPVIHHCYNRGSFKPAVAYQKAQEIIRSQNDANRFGSTVWESDWIVPQLDLYKVHHFDNRAKTTSLKALEFAMRSDSIEDLPFDPALPLRADQIDTLLAYNLHDTRETVKFFHKSREQVDFRRVLTERYGVNFTNHNDTKIGKDFFIMELEKASPGICFDRSTGRKVPNQTHRPHGIHVGQILFPYVRFNHPEFNRVLNYLRTVTIHDTKDAPELKGLHAIIDGFRFDFGTGGIHGSVSKRTVRADDQYMLIDVDVTSMYPCLAIANRVYPAHISELFCDIYASLFEQRKQYPKTAPESAMLKLALNGVYGDSNNIYSPFYDPQYTMAITINGQLSICMLCESFISIPGVEIIQANTDGVTARVPRSQETLFRAACTHWEQTTGLQLESVNYRLMAIRDVNNYISVTEGGKIKRKGAYEYVTQWHQDPSALIVAKAAECEIVHGIPAADVINNHTDGMDFMMRAKVPRSSRIETTDGQTLQNTLRYTIAKYGPSLVKVMPPLAKKPGVERRISIIAGWSVQVCNHLRDFDWNNLDRLYYVKEAQALIEGVKG